MLYVILFWTAKLYPGCQRLHAADTEASNRTREKKPLVPAVAKLRLLIYETIANNYDIKLQIFSPVSLRRLCKVVTVSCVHAFFPYDPTITWAPGVLAREVRGALIPRERERVLPTPLPFPLISYPQALSTLATRLSEYRPVSSLHFLRMTVSL